MINNKKNFSIKITHSATNNINKILNNTKKTNLNFRIYITGGGCNGFSYGFKLDTQINKNDIILQKPKIIIDPISFQYLIGGEIDYVENLEGSKFVVKNPNAKTTCGCGSSFGI